MDQERLRDQEYDCDDQAQHPHLGRAALARAQKEPGGRVLDKIRAQSRSLLWLYPAARKEDSIDVLACPAYLSVTIAE